MMSEIGARMLTGERPAWRYACKNSALKQKLSAG
jgi:hypothetical protein